jgi:hypothetical protein
VRAPGEVAQAERSGQRSYGDQFHDVLSLALILKQRIADRGKPCRAALPERARAPVC